MSEETTVPETGPRVKDSYDFRQGWVINPQATPQSFETKAAYVDNGTDMLSPQRYYSPEFKTLEWERMWTKTWTIAGRVSDLAKVGDWFKYDIGPESILIVRTTPDTIRAYYNTCQHRGNRLVREDCGHSKVFRCAFHAWAWKTDGKLSHIPDIETYRPEVLRGTLDLPTVRCDSWGGFVFICMDDKAPPLLEFLDVLVPHLAPYQFERMVLVKDVQVEWPINWKTALDAFLESQHVHVVHPEILPLYDDYFQQWDLYGNGMSRMLMRFGTASPRWPDQKSVNPALRQMLSEAGIDPDSFKGDAGQVREAIQQAKLANPQRLGYDISGYEPNQMTDDWAYFVFPNVTLNIHPEGALVQRFRPHPTNPERVIYDVTVLVHPIHDPSVTLPAYMGVPDGTDLSGNTRPARTYLTPGDGGLGPVLEQDGVTLPHVQRGLHSRGFKGARFSEQEQRLRHYHREIERYLADQKW